MSGKEIDGVPDLKLRERDIELLANELEQYRAIYGPLFRRREQREAASVYLEGLLSQLPRKSVEPMALSLLGPEETKVRTLQQFISIGAWDDAPILRRHWAEVDRLLGEDDGVLIIDGSDFPKQGKNSVGVKRQHCGQLGKKANCQAGVFLAYASSKGYTLLHRRLYMPEDWLSSPEFAARRKDCAVAQDLAFTTKPQLGGEMVEAVREAGTLRCRWVVMDEAFGHDTALLDRIERAGLWYLAEVQHSDRVWLRRPVVVAPNWEGWGRTGGGPKQTRPRLGPGEPPALSVVTMAAQLASTAWKRLVIKEGSKGPMRAEFACVRCVAVRDGLPGPDVWLVLRRSLSDGELKAYLSNAPAETPRKTFARISGMRWPIETCFEDGKQRLGMGDYEVRSWKGWHHHQTLVILAHAFLVRLRLRLGKKGAGADAAAGARHPQRRASRARAGGASRHQAASLHTAAQPRRLPLTP